MGLYLYNIYKKINKLHQKKQQKIFPLQKHYIHLLQITTMKTKNKKLEQTLKTITKNSKRKFNISLVDIKNKLITISML